ncbi:heme exporter protein CcmD [Chelatococcus asaccharovorans]|uniref:Heme export protein D (CcmD) n=1 Tax=Chelatococcus asaccharovorans TaxID=28210 RepID=A0A2V3U7S0_9HYPH|nr:heme exporter protein CcmD [Chelatococcus asaccharovorans]MBS7705751.1 heme exporter protein CcmD [Chelatococcus asaccharovorans]PXW58770.1 heme export protein D (CcmD) [Chelatococcus asaccharovorans]
MIALDSPHIGFVLAAYMAAAIVIAGLVLRAVIDSRMRNRALDILAARGVARHRVPSSGHPEGASAVRTISDGRDTVGSESSAQGAGYAGRGEGEEGGTARSHDDGRSDRR